MQFPKFKQYSDFKESVAEYEKMKMEDVLEVAKNHLQQGSKHLTNLMNTDPKLRNNHFLENEQLQQLNKVVVMNSLLASRIKMSSAEERKGMKCSIDYANSCKHLLLLKV